MGKYRPPGVYAQEEIRSIAPSPIPNADVIAIVSEVPSAFPFAERVTLTGTAAVELSKEGAVGTSIKIFSRDESVEYVTGTDFTVTSSGADDYGQTKSIARVSNVVTDENFSLDDTSYYELENSRGAHDLVVTTTTPSKTYVEFVDYVYDRYYGRLVALEGGTLPTDGTEILVDYKYGIASGEEVLVRYNYSNEEYYSHTLLNDESEVFAKYGYPFKENGSPNPLSLAAWLAFTNGGPQTQVLAVPVNPHSVVATRTVATQVEWQEAFDSIIEDEVSMVVETSGSLAYHGLAITHVLGASNYNQERIAILGRDGVVDPTVTRNVLRSASKAINNKRIVYVSSSVWETVDTVNGVNRDLGGQYAAAAVAGKLTLYNPQDTLTRKSIANIRTKGLVAEALLTGDSEAGLFVIENKGGFMRVRHSITTMFADVNQRELNIVRAQDFLVRSLREILDRSVIGLLMEPDVDFLVQGAVTNVLDRMKNSYVIADYQSPQVFQDETDPTRLRVRFEYLPNYALNEISIEFSLQPFGTSVVSS